MTMNVTGRYQWHEPPAPAAEEYSKIHASEIKYLTLSTQASSNSAGGGIGSTWLWYLFTTTSGWWLSDTSHVMVIARLERFQGEEWTAHVLNLCCPSCFRGPFCLYTSALRDLPKLGWAHFRSYCLSLTPVALSTTANVSLSPEYRILSCRPVLQLSYVLQSEGCS